jgi:hypothetical protein
MQALYALALAPIAETLADRNSYGASPRTFRSLGIGCVGIGDLSKVVCKLSYVGGRVISNEQRLMFGLGAAEAETEDGLGAEIDFAADEAMLPIGVHGEGVGQEADTTLVIGSTDKHSLWIGAGLERLWRPLEARGSGLPSVLGFDVVGGHEAV